MSYLVLARKYRPRNFTEMVGQDHVVQALTNALTTRRLHHAWLFTGTRGVGKTTVSRILAKSLNCQGVDGTGDITATPCGVCQACTDIDAGRFVDYTELDAASNRGVGEVQVLLEQAVYKPVQGRFKVFMIDEVHMLTGHAFNAMLKTLEEPPEYLKFVLATTDPQKVPVTVLSRCLQFNLRPMAPETIREHLTQVLALENVSAEVQALRLLSRAARGSMRDALSLTDQAIAFGAGQLQEATVRQMLGSVDRSYVFRLIEALALGDGKTVVQTCEALRTNGLSAASTLEEMSTVLQRMAVVQALADATAAQADDADPEAADTARLAALLPADETQLLYSICLHGRADLGLAPDEYAALTMVLLRLLAFKPAKPASPHPAGQGVATQTQSGSLPPAEKKTLTKPEAPGAAHAQPAAPVPDASPVAAPAAHAPASGTQAGAVGQSPIPPRAEPKPQPQPQSVAVPRAVQPWEDEPPAPPAPPVPSAPPVAASVVAPATPFPQPVPPGSGYNPVSDTAPTGVDNATVPPGQRLPVRDAVGRDAADRFDDPPDEPTGYALDDSSDGEAAYQDSGAEGEADYSGMVEQPPLATHPAQPLRGVAGVSKVVAVPVREQVPPRFEAQTPAAQVLIPTEEGAFWHATVMQLVQTEAIGALVRELALQSQLVARDTDQWLLRVEQESLNQQGSRDRLASALQAAGHAVQLAVEIGRVTDSPGRRNLAASAEKQLVAEKLILEAPFVQAMMRDFGATIVPGSIKPL